jgi:hypothetical protein
MMAAVSGLALDDISRLNSSWSTADEDDIDAGLVLPFPSRSAIVRACNAWRWTYRGDGARASQQVRTVCWQPVVHGEGGLGIMCCRPKHQQSARRTAEAVHRLWLSACPLACCAGGVVAGEKLVREARLVSSKEAT